ncbi:alpha/beta hydrolase [Pelagibius litoralis]|uniref:Alpha/beta hydrolase n=1 Tax=Pelagibius litoralis TaxID=374515 RepID=A0A967CA09_9PROT|nr:alpha/beta hydrolase [Pelagibius litoralis]NIA67019.1 alpha/beta hydrolase [Pelagibius litoralis]
MTEAHEDHLLCLSKTGFHKLSYRVYGLDHPRPIVCVHGLGRNARDFDTLAGILAAGGRRVICADVVGRGASGWLNDPMDYGYPQYLADMSSLIARLDCQAVDWVGTSMGGLIGMMLAAMPGNPIRRLVVNDVGAFIPKNALLRIFEYFGKDPYFPDLAAAEVYLREIYRSFGDLMDEQWCHLTETSLRRDGAGWRLHYDPQIAAPLEALEVDDLDLWSFWDAITCPVLLLRGAESDLLLRETAEEMTRRGPKATLREFPGCGHAPALLDRQQTEPVVTWLASES